MHPKNRIAIIGSLSLSASLGAMIMAQPRDDDPVYEIMNRDPFDGYPGPRSSGMYANTHVPPSGISKVASGWGMSTKRTGVKAARKQARQNKRKRK